MRLRRNQTQFGDQESVAGDRERGVMMEAAATSALTMSKADLLLEFPIVRFDPPSHLSRTDEVGKLGLSRQGREPVLGWLDFAVRPFDQEPFLSVGDGAPVIAMGRPNPNGGKA